MAWAGPYRAELRILGVSLAVVPEVLALCAYLLVPGFGLSLSTRVVLGRSPFTFLAFAFAMGFASVGSISLVLALLGMLDPLTLSACWVVGSVTTFLIALRRGSLRAHALRWAEDIRRGPWEAAANALVIVSAGVARWLVPPVSAIGPTVPRYWADALEIAAADGFPDGSLQWGRILPPTTSKAFLNAFNAGVSELLGRDLVTSQAALLFVATLGLVLIAIALFRELGIRRWAPLGGLLLFLDHAMPNDLVRDLTWNLAENWGRLAAFAGILAWCLAWPALCDDGSLRRAGESPDPNWPDRRERTPVRRLGGDPSGGGLVRCRGGLCAGDLITPHRGEALHLGHLNRRCPRHRAPGRRGDLRRRARTARFRRRDE